MGKLGISTKIIDQFALEFEEWKKYEGLAAHLYCLCTLGMLLVVI